MPKYSFFYLDSVVTGNITNNAGYRVHLPRQPSDAPLLKISDHGSDLDIYSSYMKSVDPTFVWLLDFSISISRFIARCSNLAVLFLKSVPAATNHGAAAT